MLTSLPGMNAGPLTTKPSEQVIAESQAVSPLRDEAADEEAASPLMAFSLLMTELAMSQPVHSDSLAGHCPSCKPSPLDVEAERGEGDAEVSAVELSHIAAVLSLPAPTEVLPSVSSSSARTVPESLRHANGAATGSASADLNYSTANSSMPLANGRLSAGAQATLAANPPVPTHLPAAQADLADPAADLISRSDPTAANPPSVPTAALPSGSAVGPDGPENESLFPVLVGRGPVSPSTSPPDRQPESTPLASPAVDESGSPPSAISSATRPTGSTLGGRESGRDQFSGLDDRYGNKEPLLAAGGLVDRDNLGHEDTAFSLLSSEAARGGGGSAPDATRSSTSPSRETDVAQQLMDRVKMISQRAGQIPARIEIELDPPELGRLSIELTDSDRGIIARIVTNRETTATLVDSQLSHLRQSLHDAGVNVRDFHISTDLGQSPSQNFGRHAEEETRRDEKTRPINRMSSDSRSGRGSVNRLAAGRVDIRL